MAHIAPIPPQAIEPAASAAPAANPANLPDPAVQTRSRVRAQMDLEFAYDAETGCTRLRASHQEPPLKAVRTFAAADGAALLHLHNVSGGLLGGDELSLNVNLAPGAIVQLTTTGATRIYRPRADSAPTRQANQITVGKNALLEYVPDPIIPYARARFSQRTTIHLSPGAGLFWWEILSPGREAHGEVFQYESLELSTDVVAGGRPICSERVRLRPGEHDLASAARMGSHRYWATFYICRVGAESRDWRALEDRIRDQATALYPFNGVHHEARWGVSTLPSDGLVVRGMAHHGRDAYAGLLAFWRVAKRALYGKEPVLPRKLN